MRCKSIGTDINRWMYHLTHKAESGCRGGYGYIFGVAQGRFFIINHHSARSLESLHELTKEDTQ